MGDVVDLKTHLEDNFEFITDIVKQLLTEAQVRKKYRLAESDWEKLGSSDSLLEKIEAEKIRRIRDGRASESEHSSWL